MTASTASTIGLAGERGWAGRQNFPSTSIHSLRKHVNPMFERARPLLCHDERRARKLEARRRSRSSFLELKEVLTAPLSMSEEPEEADKWERDFYDRRESNNTELLSLPSISSINLFPTADVDQGAIEGVRSVVTPQAMPWATGNISRPSDRRQSTLTVKTEGPGTLEHITEMQLCCECWGYAWAQFGQADVFVNAVSLRHTAHPSTPPCDGVTIKGEHGEEETVPDHGDVLVQARVRPCDEQRKSFYLQRMFNLADLRATIPEPRPNPHSQGERNYRDWLEIVRRRYDPDNINSIMKPPLRGYRRRKSTTALFSLSSTGHGLPGRNGDRVRRKPISEMPMLLECARCYLPALAAIRLSDFIRDGDSIDLPMPRPEAWHDTVRYVYGIVEEPTEAAKENIVYLGGKAL